jgi:hypothetical protein
VLTLFNGRTVPGSIPGGVIGFFSNISPSDRTMALGSTQPLVKMSTRDIPGGKGGRCVRLTTSPPLRAECHGIWEPKPPGTLWATPGLLQDSFTFTVSYHNLPQQLLHTCYHQFSRSQWPRGLRRRSGAARLLRIWVRIPTWTWMYVFS